MSEWPLRRIGDFVNVTDFVANGSFAALKENVAYRDEPDYAVLVRLVDYSNNWSGPFVYVDKAGFAFLKKSALQSGDVVISNVGANAGTVFRVPDLGLPMTLGPNSVVLKGMLVPRYWYYYFASPQGKSLLDSIISGSAQPKFNKTDLRACLVPYPSESHQKDVASTLGALDDKIELNRCMNETLEAMARALFKDWFVDFGPTRAKMEGRVPYLPPEISQLFPDRLDAEGVPIGWGETRIENLLELHYGKSLPASDRADGPNPVYGSGGINGFHCRPLIDGPAIIVGRKGTVGSLYWEHRPCFPIDTVFYVQSRLPKIYCYYLLERLGLRDMNTDAAVPGLNRANVYRLMVPKAPAELIFYFDKLAGLIRSKITSNLEEISTLRAMRDLLLPKLMSGSIRVDTETKELKMVEQDEFRSAIF